MVYATAPFEYIHLDFMELPDATDGSKHVLVVVDDFSLTTLLHPCPKADTETVVKVLLDQWLSHYPDPLLLHTDGGSHFDNAVVKALAKIKGWPHTKCTPYAKWAHGVAERANRTAKDILTTLCRDLDIPVNKWPRVVKLVQGAINRMPRMSRGGLSPLQITTGITPPTAAAVIRREGIDISQLDDQASLDLDTHAKALAALLQEHWDLANTARRHMSARNRARTSRRAIPNLQVGDHVLYAVHKPDTKLDYTWRGPGIIEAMPNPLICTVTPCTGHHSKSFDAHVSRVRRFAGAHLNITEQLRAD